jgi:hypothetical protein
LVVTLGDKSLRRSVSRRVSIEAAGRNALSLASPVKRIKDRYAVKPAHHHLAIKRE